ncbi:MAG: hybrid sensor histidine kinase/response regulator [Candidatus Omnitrophota bacterium]
MSRKHAILCVDDEKYNLDALYRTLRTKYKVLTAQSGMEGLEILRRNPISLIITDQRMPQMTGVEFLEKTIHLYPDVPRIILTGFTDTDDLIGAINKGRVYGYITKPWEGYDLLMTVQRALESMELTLENRRLYKNIIHLEKLATVGQVVAGIAHEVNNQMCVVMGVRILQEKYAEDELVNTIAKNTCHAAERIVNILDGIKNFAKQDQVLIHTHAADVSKLFEQISCIVELDPDVKNMTLEIAADDCPPIRCDSEKLVQVLINLIRNAAHAMKGSGVIRLSAKKKGNGVRIAVMDSGGGVPPEILENIWQPFFSTKGEKGTGLGLSICKKIVEAHGGEIHCDNEPGQGAAFILTLPASPME